METIDRNTWPREEHYRFFASMSHPFYSLTFPVNVTALRHYIKEKGLSFYAAMVFLVTKTWRISAPAPRHKPPDSRSS